jgi:hypothetical protein
MKQSLGSGISVPFYAASRGTAAAGLLHFCIDDTSPPIAPYVYDHNESFK